MFDNKAAYTGDIAKDWGPKLWLGIFLVVFGVFAFFAPKLTFTGLIVLFGGICLLVGIIQIANAIMGSMLYKSNLFVLFEGALIFLIGLIVLLWPDVTGYILLLFFGLVAFILGLFRIFEAVMMPSEVKNVLGRPAVWILLLSGIFGVIIGILFMAFPWGSLIAVLWMAGLFAIIFGVMVIAAAMVGSKK